MAEHEFISPPLRVRVLYAVGRMAFVGQWTIEHMGLLLVFLIVMVASPVISGLLNIIINGVLTGFSYVVAPFGL